MLHQDKITQQISENACKQVSDAVVNKLRGMKDLFSSAVFDLGAAVGLENMWDEICVQIKTQRTATWDWYEHLIINFIGAELKKLDAGVLSTIWLQTSEGKLFIINEIPTIVEYSEEEISKYILNEFVLTRAM